RPPSHVSRVQIRATREGRERLREREVLDAERHRLKQGPPGVTTSVNGIAASPLHSAVQLWEPPLKRQEPWAAWHGFARLLPGPVASRGRRDLELLAGPQHVNRRHAESTRDLRDGL